MIPSPLQLPRRYSLLRPLGRGGEGAVFLVRDACLGNALLSLKVLSGDLAAGRESIEALLTPRMFPPGKGATKEDDPLASEFLVKCCLAHPGLARVRDFGRLPDGRTFFTSDYAPGLDLLEWGLAHPFREDWKRFATIAAQALGALHAVHAAGFVHGDVKPANMIVQEVPGPAGARLTLIDFGSARPAGAGPRTGTPAYLGPRDLRGGPAADLHALGMSLFHASAGRLPFALGDDEALESWRRECRGARLGEWVDGPVPRAAEVLVERLTGPGGEGRFRSAREALDFLSKAVSFFLPPLDAGSGRLIGRDEELDRILHLLRDPLAPLVVIASPPGLGKSRLLEETLRRAQVEGFATVLALPGEPARALDELIGLAGSGPGALPSGDPPALGLALLDRLVSARVLVGIDGLLDGNGSSPSPAVIALRSLARGYLSRPTGRMRIAAASSRPDVLRRDLESWKDRLREVSLGPLDREELREMAVEFFRTESIPAGVIDRLAEDSRGAPGRAREVLRSLAAAGARTDPLGLLQAPEKRDGRTETQDLDPVGLERVALVVAALAPGPFDPPAAVRWARSIRLALDPGLREEDWEAVLDGLYWKGLLVRTGKGPWRYALADPGTASRWLDRIPAASLSDARREILEDLKRRAADGGRCGGDGLLALARAALWAADLPLACRAALRAVRALSVRLRFADGLRLLREILSAADIPVRERRTLAMREAEIALLDGGKDPIESARVHLEASMGSDASSGLHARARTLLGRLLERAGRLEEAGRELAAAIGILEERAGGRGDLPVLWYEGSARLAAIRFASGHPEEAAKLLDRGPALASRVAETEAGAGCPILDDIAGASRALSRFAALLARHGDPEGAIRLIDAGLGLAKRSGRPSLQAEPLHELGLIEAGRGRWDEARSALERCREIAEATGDRSGLLRSLVNLATLCLKRGGIDEAEGLFLKARVLADELSQDGPSSAAWMGLQVIRRDRGDLLGALRLGRTMIRRFPRSRMTLHATAHLNLGEIHLALGRPESSRRERARALVLARRCDYRFLVGYGLVGIGAVRWAVGDLRGAEARLFRAIESGRGTGGREDRALLGAANHHLGLVLRDRGEEREAMRALGRSLFHSRRAGSAPHLDAALLDLVHGVLLRGEREKAAAILSRRAGTATPGRNRFAAAALAVRSRPDWPVSMGDLLAIAGEAEEAGELLAALRIVLDARRDPALPSAPPDLLARSEALAARLLQKSPERDRRAFRAAHAPPAAREEGAKGSRITPEPPGSGAASQGEEPFAAILERWLSARGGADGPLSSERRAGGVSLSEPRAVLERELERLRRAIPAGDLWVLNESGRREPMFYAAGTAGPPLDLFSARAEQVRKVRMGGDPVWSEGIALISIPGEGHIRRVLVLRMDAADGESRRRAGLAAMLLGCLFRFRDAASREEASRKRLDESVREVHRLNAILATGKGQVETAAITRRLAEVERQALRDESAAGKAIPMPVARSPRMQDLLDRIGRIASEEIPVLIVGESGVGKDLFARTIHARSLRAGKPFVSEVCSIPESLLESELFGFVRGAFTGATEDRPGLLQMCRGGTLYLDEISEMSAALQSRLSRAIEERQARPLGAENSTTIDLRLISSTRLSLADLEASGLLRLDFFYRIKGEVLHVPPLRERREDIPLLVETFLESFARERGSAIPPVRPDALEYLSGRDWPGNVRQLENEVRRAFLLHPGPLTRGSFAEDRTADRLRETGGEASHGMTLRKARRDFERNLILDALRRERGNASRAARSLGISRRYLGILMEKHVIRLADLTDPDGSSTRRHGEGMEG